MSKLLSTMTSVLHGLSNEARKGDEMSTPGTDKKLYDLAYLHLEKPGHKSREGQLADFARDLERENARLREAAEVGLRYIEAVCFNTRDPKKNKNYADAASIIRAALEGE